MPGPYTVCAISLALTLVSVSTPTWADCPSASVPEEEQHRERESPPDPEAQKKAETDREIQRDRYVQMFRSELEDAELAFATNSRLEGELRSLLDRHETLGVWEYMNAVSRLNTLIAFRNLLLEALETHNNGRRFEPEFIENIRMMRELATKGLAEIMPAQIEARERHRKVERGLLRSQLNWSSRILDLHDRIEARREIQNERFAI